MIYQEQYEHLVKILEENNEMLKKVVSFIDKISDPDYINEERSREFASNVAADILVEILSPEQRKRMQEIMKINRS